jgi:hypothetical protein
MQIHLPLKSNAFPLQLNWKDFSKMQDGGKIYGQA